MTEQKPAVEGVKIGVLFIFLRWKVVDRRVLMVGGTAALCPRDCLKESSTCVSCVNPISRALPFNTPTSL